MLDPPRVAILISGRGSNMVSLVQGMQDGSVPAEPVLVLSNKPHAAGLERAEQLGVPTEVVSSKRIKPRLEHEKQVAEVLRRYRADWICLAGYMRLLSPWLVEQFRGRILNIHPALLPSFPGLHAQEQALEYGVKVTGCTVHLVDEECDHGPIILQTPVPVLEGDDDDSLSARVLEQEHRAYPEALKLCAEGRVKIEGRHVRVLPAAAAD